MPGAHARRDGRPVTLDTDVYLPDGADAPRRLPFVEVFHGGGSDKANTFDADHARFFAEHGYVSLIYSQRGHGASGRPDRRRRAERDARPVRRHATGRCSQPFGIDRTPHRADRLLAGRAEHQSRARRGARDQPINPYGIRFRVLEPGNTPDYVGDALVPNGVVKLSFGVGPDRDLRRRRPRARLAAVRQVVRHDRRRPLYAPGARPLRHRPRTTRSTARRSPTSPPARSAASPTRMTPPVFWAQAFDDDLFDVRAWRSPCGGGCRAARENRLYLSMGGHAAPTARPAPSRSDKLRDAARLLRPLPAPHAAADAARDLLDARPRGAGAGRRVHATRRRVAAAHRAGSGRRAAYAARSFGAGRRRRARAARPRRPGRCRCAGAQADPGSDGGAAGRALGHAARRDAGRARAAGTNEPGVVAGFVDGAVRRPTASSAGTPRCASRWTPNAPDTELAAKLYDQAPDGTLTLVARGVQGLRGAIPGRAAHADGCATNDFSVLVHEGHRVLLTRHGRRRAASTSPSRARRPAGRWPPAPASTITLAIRG